MGKLHRMLEPSGYGAIVDNPTQLPKIMSLVQGLGEIPDKKAYQTWNMGTGMVIATTQPYKVMKLAEQNGIYSQRIGQVVHSDVISINSRGSEKPGEWLNFFL